MDTEGLSIICSGIGFAEEDESGALIGYTKGEFCLDNLKDLQRFLRRDDPQRRYVFKQICKWNTVSRDLVPLIEHYQSDRNLIINAVKVLVFLTMPIDHSSDNVAQQIEYLWDLKSAMTRHATIAVIVSLLEDPLCHLEQDTFTEDDWKLVQLVLTLFRNVLAIHDITLQQKSAGSATQFFCLTDKFLELMFQENVMDLILVLTQHLNDSSGYLQQDNILLLETFYYIFLGQEPELIAKFSKKSSKVNEDIINTVDSLKSLMEEEAEKRRITRLRNLERHSQFSGTFTRLCVDGSKTVFKRNPTSASGNDLIKVRNVQRGPLKRIAWDHGNLPSAKGNTLELLHEFSSQFLSGGYNVLMQSIYHDIMKECQSIQKADILIFFRVATFVLAFQHQKILISKEPNMQELISDPSHENLCGDNTSFHGDVCGPVAATINEAMFKFVISKWLEAFDSLKETNDYKSLSAAGSLFKNMIGMLDLVLKVLPEDSKETHTARVLLYKLFYDQTDQGLTHFLLNMFKSFNTHKQPKSDLADLLEIIHIMLRLMEKLQARGTLRVARKSRKSRKKKISKGAEHTEADNFREHINPRNSDDKDDNETREHISETLEESNNLEENQLTEPSLANEGVDQKGTSNCNQVAEFATTLQNIGYNGDDMVPLGGEKANTNSIEHVHEQTDSSSDDQLPETNEVDFNISRLVATFANNCVIHNLCWLLKYYRSNTVSTNHHIICMFRRICQDLDISPMLYQLSILRIFYDILADQKSSPSKEYASIVNFLTKFIRKMLKLFKDRPLLFVEILFWKTRRECHCISADALIADLSGLKNDDAVLSNGTNFRQKSMADSLGDDEFMIPFGLNNTRQLSFDLLLCTLSRSQIKNASKRQRGYVFDQEQETTIKSLYDRYKDDRRCSRLIAEALDPEGNIAPVQVYRKLKQLGLHTMKRKKSAGTDAPLSTGDDPVEEAGAASTSTAIPRSLKEQGKNSYPEASIRRRKRIQAFSRNQELEIKILFERFKHHKKCSYMIAKALDDDNTYTSSQVSRKLKELGLVVSKEKSPPEPGEHSKNKENSEKGLLLEETLLAIKNRKKRSLRKEKPTVISQHVEMPEEDNSGEETLRNILNQRKRSKSTLTETAHENVSPHKVIVSGDDSDEAVLATLFKVERQLDQSIQKEETGAALDNDAIEDEQQPNQPLEDEVDTVDDMTAGLGNPSNLDQDREVDFDLADSGDEMGYRPTPLPKIGYKRNLKLVIDDEDDE
ncbi:hypothetical protein Cni_G04437 [Canna indica]|uniref:Timeless N-terminal domain-containing protein n=1 Tax=Canna indica TaxID=4628 RepID=A0AAQ3Q278_9LILI|nr:hypothetical protein Cni_G04437 [Canna indica]